MAKQFDYTIAFKGNIDNVVSSLRGNLAKEIQKIENNTISFKFDYKTENLQSKLDAIAKQLDPTIGVQFKYEVNKKLLQDAQKDFDLMSNAVGGKASEKELLRQKSIIDEITKSMLELESLGAVKNFVGMNSSEIEKTKQELQDVKQQLEETRNRVDELNASLEHTVDDYVYDELKQKLNETIEKIEALKRENEDLRTELSYSVSGQSYSVLSEEYDDALREISELKYLASTLNVDNEAQHETIIELNTQLAVTEEKLKSVSAKMEQLQDARKTMGSGGGNGTSAGSVVGLDENTLNILSTGLANISEQITNISKAIGIVGDESGELSPLVKVLNDIRVSSEKAFENIRLLAEKIANFNFNIDISLGQKKSTNILMQKQGALNTEAIDKASAAYFELNAIIEKTIGNFGKYIKGNDFTRFLSLTEKAGSGGISEQLYAYQELIEMFKKLAQSNNVDISDWQKKYGNSFEIASNNVKELLSSEEQAETVVKNLFESFNNVNLNDGFESLNIDLSELTSQLERISILLQDINSTLSVLNYQNLYAITSENGDTQKWYRGVKDVKTGVMSDKDTGSFWTTNKELAESYAGSLGKVYEAELKAKKVLEVDAHGSESIEFEYLGSQTDEASIKISEAANRIIDIEDKIEKKTQELSMLEKTNMLGLHDSKINAAKATLEELSETLTRYQDIYDSVAYDDSNPYGMTSFDELALWANQNGYDTVLVNNVRTINGEVEELASNIAIFDANQIQGLKVVGKTAEETAQVISNSSNELSQANSETANTADEENKSLKGVQNQSDKTAEAKIRVTKANKDLSQANQDTAKTADQEAQAMKNVKDQVEGAADAIAKTNTIKPGHDFGERNILSQTGLFKEGHNFSFIEKTQDGQIQETIGIWNEKTKEWNLSVGQLKTTFSDVQNQIIALYKAINKEQIALDKETAKNPFFYGGESAQNLIDLLEARRASREKFLKDTYSDNGEYAYKTANFEKELQELREELELRRQIANEISTSNAEEKVNEKNAKNFLVLKKQILALDEAINNAEMKKTKKESRYADQPDYDMSPINKQIDILSTKRDSLLKTINEDYSGSKELLEFQRERVELQKELLNLKKIENADKDGERGVQESANELSNKYNILISSLNRYLVVQKRIASNKMFDGDIKEADELDRTIAGIIQEFTVLSNKNGVSPTIDKMLNNANRKMHEIAASISDVEKTTNNGSTRTSAKETSEIENAYNTLARNEDRLAKLRKAGLSDLTESQKILIKLYEDENNEAKKTLKLKEEEAKGKGETLELTEAELAAQKRYNDALENSKKYDKAAIATRVNKIKSSTDLDEQYADLASNATVAEQYAAELEVVKNKIIELKANKISKLTDDSSISEIKEVEREIEELKRQMEELSFDKNFNSQRFSAISKINLWLDKNTRASESSRMQLKAYANELQNGVKPDRLKEIQNEFKRITAEEVNAGRAGKSFGSMLSVSFRNLTRYLLTFASFYRVISLVRQAIQTITELDTALVDLRKTTQMNNVELNEFYANSSNIAKQLGVTTKSIIEQAAAWSRLGYSSKEQAETMAKLSSQFTSISPGMTTEAAQEGLVAAMKGFGIEVDNVERKIMDNVNKIGNTMATTNADIISMLERSSAAMKAANNSIEETIALESAAVEITQNAESTGTAFRTISMRIRGYDEETEELSDDLKTISGDIADLTKTANNKNGISLFSDSNKTTYKSTYQILKDISEIYDDLTDKQQAGLLEKLGGKRGGQVIAGILNDFSSVEKALITMQNAAGSADEEMSIIEDSIAYKTNALKETWVDLLKELINREDFGKIVDSLTKISEVLSELIKKGNLMDLLLGGGSMLMLGKSGHTWYLGVQMF